MPVCCLHMFMRLKPREQEECVIHSFRHSMRDRLRAVQCPSDMIDQIGGWMTAGVGQGYGEGFRLKELLVLQKQVYLGKVIACDIISLV